MAGTGLYVYGILRAGHPLPAGLRGVGKEPGPPRTFTEGPLAAVAGAAPPDLRARRRDLLAHQELLLTLAGSGPVLPMRFGMVAGDEAALRRHLREARESHLRTLELLDGRVEVNVKVLPAEDEEALARLLGEDAGLRRLSAEARSRPSYQAKVRLGEAVTTALTRRATEAAQLVRQELEPAAHAVAPGPAVTGCVLNASFLVAREDGEDFLAAARGLGERYHDRLRLRAAGPLPCYSFSGGGSPVPPGRVAAWA
ncbi:GvpL/GvpF family gas vesicle protein [Streptomyces sp. SCSIO ZS0520]|uniref:GvpL/GvpF family gas vesicle protein n=1 Tax=Streptomyces sp. SCSIO ZS0520 TaxID=2892996 RepID=UPI0021D94DF0|nr:GvpL/GvpF family gas vesicle protein [Streptomyces sp. SCSIO ZS0520]